MVNIKINNKELSVNKDLTILQAASLIDIQIPRFCYHEKLTIAGNCRMCLVEMVKVNKPVASCALPVSEGMQIYTNSILVKKAREGVLELLLANHPLDCPICDQGGECDLQEQAMIFGNDRSRFYEIKRAVADKTISPFIKTIMTRCIHCTRCIRFLNEVAGVHELGITGRGSNSEIGTYIQNSISSELSGNVIDLCPVGALTSKPYAFTARPWELRSVETIDVLDSLGTNIKVDMRGPNLMRILPKINENLNEEWITDKTRFSFDGYKAQRLNTPLYSHKVSYEYQFNNLLICENKRLFLHCNWEESFVIFKEYFLLYKKENKSHNIILGNNINLETTILSKKIKLSLGFDNIFDQYFFFQNINKTKENNDFNSNYLLNITPVDIEKIDVCLLVGTNLRLENPLLNSRLRKAFLKNNAQIASIGPTTDALYNLKKLGNSTSTFIKILEGKHSFNSLLLNGNKALILFGSNILTIPALVITKYINNNKNKTKNNIIIGSISSFISQNIKKEFDIMSVNKNYFSSNLYKNDNFNLILNADEFHLKNNFNSNLNFNVYVGFQADRIALNADLILPANSSLEESSTFVNVANQLVETNICLPAPSNTRTSWKILLALIIYFGDNKRIDQKNVENISNFNYFSTLNIKNRLNFQYNLKKKTEKNNININKLFLAKSVSNNFISNYYKTDSITRNSRIMSQMTKQKNLLVQF